MAKLCALAALLVLAAAACAQPVGAPESSHGAESAARRTAPAVPASAPQATSSGGTVWRTYRNEQAGFMIGYPAYWVVREGSLRKGSPVVTFLEPSGAGAITIRLSAAAPLQVHRAKAAATPCPRPKDLSNTRCPDVVPRARFAAVTGKASYVIVASSQSAADVYDRMVASFRLLP
jgi:hypothetical protein